LRRIAKLLAQILLLKN